jgi:hypothetical protein
MIGLSILLQENMWTDPENKEIVHRHMIELQCFRKSNIEMKKTHLILLCRLIWILPYPLHPQLKHPNWIAPFPSLFSFFSL